MKGFWFLLRKKKIYACPFHPEERLEAPGQCPHCGMCLLEAPPRQGSLEQRRQTPWGRR